ncbi:multidrug efflux MFS transporter [Micrococcales bacterium 31B]|nr:multidrug efflux MFS transporter [Micrococcales bacterium 31B]
MKQAEDSQPGALAATTKNQQTDDSARNNRVIWLLVIATFVVILNETVMSVAIANLATSFAITELSAQWASTAFMLTMAVVIPVTGWLLQRLATRQIFIIAMSLFSVGTLVAIVAPTFSVLILGRVVQAAGTAVMMPLLMTTLMMLVPQEHQGQMMARVSMTISVAPALGPTIGGYILDWFAHWQALFIFMAPISITMLVVGIRLIENVTEGKQTRLDTPSIPLAAIGFGGLVFGLTGFAEHSAHLGSGAAITGIWVPVGAGILALAAFVARQVALQRSDRALLDLRTLNSKNFTFAALLMIVNMVVLFGCIMLLQLYLQRGLGLPVNVAGMVVLPGGLAMGLLAPTVGRLYDRFGPRPLMVPGAVLVSASLWTFTSFGTETSMYLVAAVYVLLSVGLACLFTPLFTAGLGSVEPRFYSHGSAIFGTVQQLAGGIGTALFVTIMSGVMAAQTTAGVNAVHAQVAGIHTAFVVGASVSLVSIALAFLVKRPQAVSGVVAGHH